MVARHFEQRLATVRHRFSSTLESKIEDVLIMVTHMTGNSRDAVEEVVEGYRRIHAICGIAPTVGFAQTGHAARAAEVVLMSAYLSKRALTSTEAAALNKTLGALKRAAQADMQVMYSRAM